MKKQLGLLALLYLLCLNPLLAEVEQARETDEHIIYYNVLPTSALPEAMARAYDITRSDTRVLLNITVHEKGESSNTPVAARIQAQAVNLTGQLKRFSMREIIDDGAIYYIGSVGIRQGENLNFQIQVTPEGSKRTETIELRRSF